MSTEHCKLAAVLFADMVGYSAKRSDRALELRREMLTLANECLTACQGRLIQTAGDEVFAEFPSGSAAITCAIRLQDAIARRNTRETPEHRFLLRVGINVGEVTMDGEDLIGNTVNIAKRTEQLAASGGICVTEPAWRQAEADLRSGFTRLGTIRIKADPPKQIFFHRYGANTAVVARVTHQFRVRYARLGPLAAVGTVLPLFAVASLLAWILILPDTLVNWGMRKLARYDLPGNIERGAAYLKIADFLNLSQARAKAGLAWACWLQYKNNKSPELRSDAERFANSALTLNPNVLYGLVVLGLSAKENTNYSLAIDYLVKANDHTYWTNGSLLVLLADAKRKAGDKDGAVFTAQRAEKMAGQSWETWQRLGQFWYFENNYSNSLHAFLQAGRKKPVSLLSTENAIGIMGKSEKDPKVLDQVLVQARDVKERNRKSPDAWANYGTVCLWKGISSEAGQAFETAASLCRTEYSYFGSAGLAYFSQTDVLKYVPLLQEAVLLAEADLRETPSHTLVRARLALYQASLSEKASTNLSHDLRISYRQKSLEDAKKVMEEVPLTDDNSNILSVVYSTLDLTNRFQQDLDRWSGKKPQATNDSGGKPPSR